MLPEMLPCLLLPVTMQFPLELAFVLVLYLLNVFFFFLVPSVFLGLFILLLEQYFYSNLRTTSLAQCFGLLILLIILCLLCLLLCMIIFFF